MSRPAANEIWIVTSPYGENKVPGDPIHYNSIISLKHETTGGSLHATEHNGKDYSILMNFFKGMI